MAKLPARQQAVQLVGPDQLTLNAAKPVPEPGPRQFLCRVEVCGLCFSDLKLLKQFAGHVRKSAVVAGIAPEVLKDIPSYVPGNAPTVPGHEPVVEIVRIGPGVTRFKPGERYLVQADWRWLKTANSNGAFGYNFEGALQEYVLLDERIVVSPAGESMLLPAAPDRSASAVALVEPWACVEQSYQVRERTNLKAGGRMLVVAEAVFPAGSLVDLVELHSKPARLTWVGRGAAPQLRLPLETAAGVAALPDAQFDDVLYFGSNPETVEQLFAKVAPHGLFNLCLCGGALGRPVQTAIGRVHYGGIRLIGTPGNDPANAMRTIPAKGEIREGNKVHIVGAGGPMGVMHVMRNLCQGVKGVMVIAADLSDERLAALDRIALPAARRNGVEYCSYNSKKSSFPGNYDYAVIMAPVPALIAQAVREANTGGIVNVFAGIPATVSGPLDLDAYAAKGLYMIGTSGSLLSDMQIVLDNVRSGRLDTNVSVAAVSGLDGAVEGIRLMEKQAVPGKIMIYPACKGLKVTPLDKLADTLPEVAAKLEDGVWSNAAEAALLKKYQGQG